MESCLDKCRSNLKLHSKEHLLAIALPVVQVGVIRKLLCGMLPQEPTILLFRLRAIIHNAYLVHRMGELESWIDENFIRNVWFQMGEQVNVKMIRDKFSG